MEHTWVVVPCRCLSFHGRDNCPYDTDTWEFPKIGDPNIYSTLNSRILIIRTPKYGTPHFRKLPHGPMRLRPDQHVALKVRETFEPRDSNIP